MDQFKLYVGNFPYETTSTELVHLFSQFGEVLEAMVIPNKRTGQSKGFGFVTFGLESEAQNAMSLNGSEFNGRSLVVKPAKENKD